MEEKNKKVTKVEKDDNFKLTDHEKKIIKFVRSPLYKIFLACLIIAFCYGVGYVIGQTIANFQG